MDLVPRDLYPRLSFPLMFAKMRKVAQTRLVGFALFEEAFALRSMRAEYRRVLQGGRRVIRREVVEMALRASGGSATLAQIYELLEGFRPVTGHLSGITR